MNFLKVIRDVVGALETAGIRYAVIGGFAMGLRGVQRATMDLDIILMLEDLEKAHVILGEFGYQRTFHSENVSHYESTDYDGGRIDILHAFRGPSLGMLRRAEAVAIDAGVTLRVVQIEDLIGLKVQAMANDPSRLIRDWDDIRQLLQSAGSRQVTLDWELLGDYLRLFGWEEKLSAMRDIYGQTER